MTNVFSAVTISNEIGQNVKVNSIWKTPVIWKYLKLQILFVESSKKMIKQIDHF